MCGDVDAFKPSSWNQNCASGKCKECPKPSFPVPPELESPTATFAMWKQRDINGHRKYGLFNVVMTAEELSRELQKGFEVLKLHLFNAALAWTKLNKDLSELRPGIDCLTIEDYQRNYEVFHAEMPTTMAYAANNLQIAMYPIVLRFRRPSSDELESAAVTILSPDLRHDHQQVAVFEKR